MVRRPLKHAALALVPLVAAAAGMLAAADRPTDGRPAAGGLSGDAARMYGFVTTPHPGELKWQQIPWLTDLGEGLRQAKAERCPLLLFVSGDDPLEKC